MSVILAPVRRGREFVERHRHHGGGAAEAKRGHELQAKAEKSQPEEKSLPKERSQPKPFTPRGRPNDERRPSGL